MNLLLQQRSHQRQNVLRNNLVACRRSMRSIPLHHAVHPKDALQQKRKHRHVILRSQQRVSLIELTDVIWPIVRRQSNPRQHFTLVPLAFSAATMRSRLLRESSIRSPRNPSLPPNSPIPTAGFIAITLSTRSTPSLVVFPLMPSFTTRYL